MKKGITITGIIFISSCIYGQTHHAADQKKSVPVSVNWVNNLAGDFTFHKKWSYPENVFKNEFGQLNCDGECPEEITKMEDKHGKILKDSLPAFYKLVDTTHQFHSILCKAWCYEWAGTDYMEVSQKNDTTYCYTLTNAATHCSLQLVILNNYCLATVDLKSIVPGGDATFYCNNGYITIDKTLWNKGILKADFSLNFDNKEKPVYWKGKIYSTIKAE